MKNTDIEIRVLQPQTDQALVADLYHRAADYVLLERGEAPSPELVDEFFHKTVPNGSLDAALKLGLFKGSSLIGIADVGFGFPEVKDAYLGLMLFDPNMRRHGLGRLFLNYVEKACQDRGIPKLYLAVLNTNAPGRAFWEKMGFAVALADVPRRMGQKDHLITRMMKPL